MESLLGGQVVETTITSRRKPGITVDSKTKTFIRRPPDRDTPPPLVMLEELGKFKGRGRELETKAVGGHEAVGFQVAGRKSSQRFEVDRSRSTRSHSAAGDAVESTPSTMSNNVTC